MRRALVRVAGQEVGHLESHVQGSTFQFLPAYLDSPTRKVLSQHYENAGMAREEAQTSVPPFFANLLPEERGELRSLMKQQHRFADDFELLLLLGQDLPGAITVHPVPEREVLLHTTAASARLRFSLAGVALKFTGFFAGSGRLVVPAANTTGDWIIKFPYTAYQAVVHNEFFCLGWARLSGLAVPEHRMITVDDVDGLPVECAEGTSVLAVQRFDRSAGVGRIHAEDMAQVLNVPPEEKYDGATYEDLCANLGSICPDDAQELLRRLVFMLLSGNGDAHLKNWGLVYPNGRTPRLSQAYDLVATRVYESLGDRLAMPLLDAETFAQVTRAHVEKLASLIGLDGSEVPRMVKTTLDALATHQSSLENQRWRNAIGAHAQAMATRLTR